MRICHVCIQFVDVQKDIDYVKKIDVYFAVA